MGFFMRHFKDDILLISVLIVFMFGALSVYAINLHDVRETTNTREVNKLREYELVTERILAEKELSELRLKEIQLTAEFTNQYGDHFQRAK